MKRQTDLESQSRYKHLIKPALIGAGIALVFISFFLISAGKGDPNWPKYWMVRPLIVVPLAGAAGGVIFYQVQRLLGLKGWKRIFSIVLGLLGFVIALWMGTILGLDGTWWN